MDVKVEDRIDVPAVLADGLVQIEDSDEERVVDGLKLPNSSLNNSKTVEVVAEEPKRDEVDIDALVLFNSSYDLYICDVLEDDPEQLVDLSVEDVIISVIEHKSNAMLEDV